VASYEGSHPEVEYAAIYYILCHWPDVACREIICSASGESEAMSALQNGIVSDAALHIDVRMRCPRCRANLNGLGCSSCGFRMRIGRGIVHALPPERAAHYARFMEDYERIRAAEGRGSESEDFYLGLPYKDVSGRNNKQWHIRARSYDYLIKHVLKRNPQDGGGRVLDLGAGNCWMSFRLALAGYSPFAVDLLANDRDGLGVAAHYQRCLSELFPRFQAEIASLPFQDEQFDAVIFNASFHYSEDYAATLREAFRCVRNGGLVIISDTPWYSREESGRQMVSERRAAFSQCYGTASDSIRSLEYLTNERLRILEEQLAIRWTIYSPRYGFKWAMRPLVAKLRRKREPSRFRIYVARKDA
jgi:SAM-dependent methyltransferase